MIALQEIFPELTLAMVGWHSVAGLDAVLCNAMLRVWRLGT